MKKLLVLILLLLATPAMADLTCKETEGCASSNPAKDCEALGYDAKTSLDKDCEHSLQCPFSVDYAKCVKWKEKEPNPDEVCPALGYQEKTKITSCSSYEYCPYDESKSKYAMCKGYCTSYGFVAGNLYQPNGNSDEGSYGYIPYCWDHIECEDSTGTYYLCKKGDPIYFCELKTDDCSYTLYNKGNTYYSTEGYLTGSTIRKFQEEIKKDDTAKLIRDNAPRCENCGLCIYIPSEVSLNSTQKNSLKLGNWKLLSQLQNEYGKDFLDFYCKKCSYNVYDEKKTNYRKVKNAENKCSGGSSSGSGGGSGGDFSSPLCNCKTGWYINADNTCSSTQQDNSVAKIYYTATNSAYVTADSANGCFAKAVALETTYVSTITSIYNCFHNKYEKLDGKSWCSCSEPDTVRDGCGYGDGSKCVTEESFYADTWFGQENKHISSFSPQKFGNGNWYVPTFLENKKAASQGLGSGITSTAVCKDLSSDKSGQFFTPYLGATHTWTDSGVNYSAQPYSTGTEGNVRPHILLYSCQNCTVPNAQKFGN